jgi:excisionase family DNA binding protein
MATAPISPPSSDLLTTAEAAAYLRTTRGTLEVWRSTKRYAIPYVKRGRNVFYRRADLDRWLESRTVSGPSRE